MWILIIEDESKTAAYLGKGLKESGFVVDVAQDGETGLELALVTDFDLVLCDVMLPHRDGWSTVFNNNACLRNRWKYCAAVDGYTIRTLISAANPRKRSIRPLE